MLNAFSDSLLPKVLLALSGGVDSAACVTLLQEQGFEVEGLVLQFSPAHLGAVSAARKTAEELGITLHVGKCEEEFEKHVVSPFCSDYAKGLTPNPCVVCNPLVKFKQLADYASSLGIFHIATGHYAQLAQRKGVLYISQAVSIARDQSYMLYRLPQEILRRLVLPAGEVQKADIRNIAQQNSLSCASAPDSQEICFVPDGEYADFITSRGVKGKKGRFIGPSGEDLGAHRGVIHYTVGQRRGLGVALGQPVFVRSILDGGDIQLAFAHSLCAKSICVRSCVFTSGCAPTAPTACTVKIRSMAKPVSCVLHPLSDGEYRIVFDEPQRSPAPGQHAVFYDDTLVIGGGVMHSPKF